MFWHNDGSKISCTRCNKLMRKGQGSIQDTFLSSLNNKANTEASDDTHAVKCSDLSSATQRKAVFLRIKHFNDVIPISLKKRIRTSQQLSLSQCGVSQVTGSLGDDTVPYCISVEDTLGSVCCLSQLILHWKFKSPAASLPFQLLSYDLKKQQSTAPVLDPFIHMALAPGFWLRSALAIAVTWVMNQQIKDTSCYFFISLAYSLSVNLSLRFFCFPFTT